MTKMNSIMGVAYKHLSIYIFYQNDRVYLSQDFLWCYDIIIVYLQSVLVTQDTKTKRRGGYNAKTEYEVVKRNDTAALLHITPHNGTATNTQKVIYLHLCTCLKLRGGGDIRKVKSSFERNCRSCEQNLDVFPMFDRHKLTLNEHWTNTMLIKNYRAELPRSVSGIETGIINWSWFLEVIICSSLNWEEHLTNPRNPEESEERVE